jgi:hypothetical protein
MSHGQPILIETLGDLAAHHKGLNAMCQKCRHRADLDMAALIDRFGAGFVYVGRKLNRLCVCGRCGAREVAVQIHNLHADRSQLAS